MSDTAPTEAAEKPIFPASTMLMIRDRNGGPGLEVFMVKRNHAIEFASGAMVFPGGKLDKGDSDPRLGRHVRPGNFAPDLSPFALGAVREAFEESGLLLARRKGSAHFLSADEVAALDSWRAPLNAGEKGLADLAEAENLDYALDALLPFAHWIAPALAPKRFNTWFFLSPAPADQIGAHDGGESIESEWLEPNEALADWEAKTRSIVFPTRMQLWKLGRAKSCAEAFENCRSEAIVDVLPVLDKDAPGGPRLCIPAEAGYGLTSIPLSQIGL